MTPEERVAFWAEYYGKTPDHLRDENSLADIIRAAVAEEREACAKMAAYIGENLSDHPQQAEAREVAARIAKAVRARST